MCFTGHKKKKKTFQHKHEYTYTHKHKTRISKGSISFVILLLPTILFFSAKHHNRFSLAKVDPVDLPNIHSWLKKKQKKKLFMHAINFIINILLAKDMIIFCPVLFFVSN